MSWLDHAEAQSRKESDSKNQDLENWIRLATVGLAPESTERVRTEIRAHIDTMMNKENITERQAVKHLGASADAAKRYSKRYLTTADAVMVSKRYKPTTPQANAMWIWTTLFILCVAVGFQVQMHSLDFYDSFDRASHLSVWAGLLFFLAFLPLVVEQRLCRAIISAPPRQGKQLLAMLILATTLSGVGFLPIVLFGTNSYSIRTMSATHGMEFTNTILSICLIYIVPYISIAITKYRKAMHNAEDCIAIIKRTWEDEIL